MTESRNNHHTSSEHTSQESVPAYREENTLAAPAPATILNRLRIGHRSLLSEMDEAQLPAALESAEWQVRVAAVQRLEKRGERAPLELLVRALKDEHEAVRAAAAQALGVLGSSKAIPSLIETLQDVTWLVRAAAVQALGMLGEQAPVEPLMFALNDEDESVRTKAVRVAGTMGERVPLERLLAALQDKSWRVREMAVLALGARGGHIPRSALTLALQDEDESVRSAAHFLQEMYPDRFAETSVGLPASVSEESGEPAVDPLQASLQRYPRKGALRVLRVALLVCWSIFLGYVVSITWNLVQLTHADQAKLTVRFVVQALSAPQTALAGFNIPTWFLGICMLLALLLFFGCLWATRDTWKEYWWRHNLGVHGVELEDTSEDQNQFTRAPVNPPQQIPATRVLSRRAVLVGLTTVLIVGNGIAWSLLISSKRRQGSSSLGLGRALYIYRGHKGSVRSVAWSPDGTRIASGSDDKRLQVWEVANGKQSFTISGLASTAISVAWSPDGTRIASEGEIEGTVQVWDATTGRKISTFHATSDSAVMVLAWSPDGGRIVSANSIGGSVQVTNTGSVQPSENPSLQVWDIANRGHSFSIFFPNLAANLLAVVWSPDGKHISSVDDNGAIQVLDISTRQSTFPFGPYGLSRGSETFTAAAYSLDGKHIAMARDNKMVEVRDSSSGKLVYTYRGHYNAPLGFIRALAWSPDGKRIASGSLDKTVQVWDAVNGEHAYIYRGHSAAVTTVAWSPDGKYIASGSDDKTVQVWDAG